MTFGLRDQASRDRIAASLDETLFVEAGAGSGKTHSLVERVVGLVLGGVPLRHVAAITFTEKAAAELRDRVRDRLERAQREEVTGDGLTEVIAGALDDLDGAAIGTLHSFAQRLLNEHPVEAGLPPRIEVQDEVSSEVAFEERWARFVDHLLDDETHEQLLHLTVAADIGIRDLRDLAIAFNANWDLVAERVDRRAADPTPPRLGPLFEEFDSIHRLRVHAPEEDRLVVRLDEFAAAVDDLHRAVAAGDHAEVVRLLRTGLPSSRLGNCGRKADWGIDIDEARSRLSAWAERVDAEFARVSQECIQRCAALVAGFTLEGAELRRRDGRLEFHDLLVMARELLRGPQGAEVRVTLRDRYQRLLLDEFQDTDPIQIELAVLLASGDPGAGARPWSDVEIDGGRLFVVGDPKQSIYRFRRADIALFLQARGVLADEPVALTTNFRTTPPVIDWVNHVFGTLIQADDEHLSQPAYQPLDPVDSRTTPPVGPPVAAFGVDAHDDDPRAGALRELEAADVAATVVQAIDEGWSVCRGADDDGREVWEPAVLGDICILIPSRLSLPYLEDALEDAGISYRAETSSLVYATREVRDLLATVRAVDDPTDQLSLVTALRSPIFGCGDDDLFTFHEHGGRWGHHRRLPDELPEGHPVGEAMHVLNDLHRRRAWLTPSELLEEIVRERRVLEAGVAAGRPRDLWRRVRFVVDQARAWSEAGGGSLREYLAWVSRQGAETTRVSEAVLPETDDDSVRIMTVHASKGLEFPIVLLSGTTTQLRGRRRGVSVTWPPDGSVGIKIRQTATADFEAFAPIDEQMDRDERLRLLYVAATRARDHLIVSLHRRAKDDGTDRTAAAVLAAAATGAVHHPLEPTPGHLAGPDMAQVELPLAFEAWQAEFSRTISEGGRPRTIAATTVAHLATERSRKSARERAASLEQLDTDPGLDKAPRDLDLPPWAKGRYGTAVGRAVHAVLQTVDLTTGAGLEEAVAAQAAAEAVIGREPVIADLVRAGLASDVVREAVVHEHWRETYVAAPVGDTTLEGYLDLLYRTEAGLVVVDYKTDAWSGEDDLDAKVDRYRLQGASYALALEAATGEHVMRCVFCFLGRQGAVERELPALRGAIDEVRGLLRPGERTFQPAML